MLLVAVPKQLSALAVSRSPTHEVGVGRLIQGHWIALRVSTDIVANPQSVAWLALQLAGLEKPRSWRTLSRSRFELSTAETDEVDHSALNIAQVVSSYHAAPVPSADVLDPGACSTPVGNAACSLADELQMTGR